MGGTAPSRALRRRPLQSVPSPLPQIPPCPSFSLGEGTPQPSPTRCPSSCTTQQPTQQQRQLRERAAAHHANTAASLPPRAALRLSGRERRCNLGPPGTDAANRGCRHCQAAPGTHPAGGAGAVRAEGAGSRRRAPSPARTPDPAYSPGPGRTQHTALPMPFLMLCCPESVCLSFPRQSSVGCAQSPQPRPQSQPPPVVQTKWVNGEAQAHKSH